MASLRDEADALAILAALSGPDAPGRDRRSRRVGRPALPQRLSTTDVRFREIDPDEARRYWHSGEPRDKAGAYAIQGSGGVFVEAIMGSYSGVVGLPVFETANLLREAGIEVLPTTLSNCMSDGIDQRRNPDQCHAQRGACRVA